MSFELPGAIPEISVDDLDAALAYYWRHLEFAHD